MKTTIVIAVLASCMAICDLGQTAEPATAKTYDVQDAYRIYSLLLPQEESYGFAKGTLVIQEETVSKTLPARPCVTPEAATRFKDVIADYERLNKTQWLLQRQFQVDKPYEVVSSDTINVLFKDGDWEGFFKRYPESGGYIVMSAVGFDKEKTRAMVYTGSSCGGLCGSWRFHLLEKIHGRWKEAPGVNCNTVS